jgi:hypothetical protein
MEELTKLQELYISQKTINIINHKIDLQTLQVFDRAQCMFCDNLYYKKHDCRIKSKVLKLYDDITIYNNTIYNFEKTDENTIIGVLPIIKICHDNITSRINKYVII